MRTDGCLSALGNHLKGETNMNWEEIFAAIGKLAALSIILDIIFWLKKIITTARVLCLSGCFFVRGDKTGKKRRVSCRTISLLSATTEAATVIVFIYPPYYCILESVFLKKAWFGQWVELRLNYFSVSNCILAQKVHKNKKNRLKQAVFMERKSYIDRISSYGCKYEATVANGCKSSGTGAKQSFIAK